MPRFRSCSTCGGRVPSIDGVTHADGAGISNETGGRMRRACPKRSRRLFRAMTTSMRFIPLLCFVLSACSIWPDASVAPPAAPPENPLTDHALRMGVTRAANGAHFTGPLEVSNVRKTDHGPGSSFVCIREVASSSGKQQSPYAVFFDGDKYKGSRLPVIIEECERQTYIPVQRLEEQPSGSEPCIAGCLPGKTF